MSKGRSFSRIQSSSGKNDQPDDIDTCQFQAEADRQSRVVAESPHADDDQVFIDSVSTLFDDAPPAPAPG